MARAKVDAVDVPASVEQRRVVLKSWFEVAVDDYGVPISFLVAAFIVHTLSSNPIFDSRAVVVFFLLFAVIVQPNLLYLNSRNRRGPEHRSPYSFGRDAQNIRMLRSALGLEGNVGQPLEP